VDLTREGCITNKEELGVHEMVGTSPGVLGGVAAATAGPM